MVLSSNGQQDQPPAIPAVNQRHQDAIPAPPVSRSRPEVATSSPAQVTFQPSHTSIAAAVQPPNPTPVRIATAVHSNHQGTKASRDHRPGSGTGQPHPYMSSHPSNAGATTPEAAPPSFTVLNLNSADNSRCSSLGGASIGGSPHAGKDLGLESEQALISITHLTHA
jgi:hypothetical protein